MQRDLIKNVVVLEYCQYCIGFVSKKAHYVAYIPKIKIYNQRFGQGFLNIHTQFEQRWSRNNLIYVTCQYTIMPFWILHKAT